MPTYITSRDLKDTFPNLDEFDTKKPVYGSVSYTHLTLPTI